MIDNPNIDVSYTDSFIYDGCAVEKADLNCQLKIEAAEISLADGIFDIELGECIDAGTYMFKLVVADETHPMAEYIPVDKEYSFTISPKSITDELISISDIEDQTFTNLYIEPTIVVTDSSMPEGRKVLVKNIDYTILFENNLNVGTAKIIITGMGNYKDSNSENPKTFNILPINDPTNSAIKVEIIGGPFIYTGSSINPAFTFTINDVEVAEYDYTYEFNNCVNAGTASLVIHGQHNLDSNFEITKNFEILPRSIVDADGQLADGFTITPNPIPSQPYTGNPVEPNIKLLYNSEELVKYVSVDEVYDYKVEFDNNINVGTATFNIVANGNFTGTYLNEECKFNITLLSDIEIKLIYKAYLYTGEYITFGSENIKFFDSEGNEITWPVLGEHYELEFENNLNVTWENGEVVAGAYVHVVWADVNGEFGENSTRSSASFKIMPLEIGIDFEGYIQFDNTEFDFTGAEIKPEFKLYTEDPNTTKLDAIIMEIKSDSYEEPAYLNCIYVGQADVKIILSGGNFKGEKTFENVYNINKVIADSTDIRIGIIGDYSYTGSAIQPQLEIFFKDNKLSTDLLNIVIQEHDNDEVNPLINAKTYSLDISFDSDNIQGLKEEIEFIINKQKLQDSYLQSINNLPYQGLENAPEFTNDDISIIDRYGNVLVLNQDYILDYSPKAEAGRDYPVSIIGINNYAEDFGATYDVTRAEITISAADINYDYRQLSYEDILASLTWEITSGELFDDASLLNIGLYPYIDSENDFIEHGEVTDLIVGQYEISVDAVNSNYNITRVNGTLTINKKTIENITFKDQIVNYNGNPQKPSVTGDLPEGVTYTLYYDGTDPLEEFTGETEIGIYNVKIVFSGDELEYYILPTFNEDTFKEVIVFEIATPMVIELTDDAPYYFVFQYSSDNRRFYLKTYHEFGYVHGLDETTFDPENPDYTKPDSNRVILGQIYVGTTLGTVNETKGLIDYFKNNNLIRITNLRDKVIYDCGEYKNGGSAKTRIATGFKVSLIIDGKERDVIYLSVLGDIRGDGVLNSTDTAMMNQYFQKKGSYELEYILAMMIRNRGAINTGDYSILNSALKDPSKLINYFYVPTNTLSYNFDSDYSDEAYLIEESSYQNLLNDTNTSDITVLFEDTNDNIETTSESESDDSNETDEETLLNNDIITMSEIGEYSNFYIYINEENNIYSDFYYDNKDSEMECEL